ncbi:MAG: DeoR/GlpR transcriptional regulator [Clostridia bacterium]|nr:DeoR/GlpR transcriptional regulator [Clostridia bacterium]
MFKQQRTDKVLEIIRENKYATVDFLVSKLHYSPATIRRDITYLADLGLVKKSYGGVSITGNRPSIIREHENISAKISLCKTASDLIKDGDTLFIDGTTTTYFLGEHILNKKDITVVTTNLKLATFLGNHKVNCYVCGGQVHDVTMLLGPFVCDMINKFKFDIAFFSVGTINSNGQICLFSPFWDFMKCAISRSSRNVLLCDKEKLTEDRNIYLTDIGAFDTVICDFKPSKTFYTNFEKTQFIISEE